MKKLIAGVLIVLTVVAALSGCRSILGRGKGPLESFVFLAARNPELPENAAGVIIERGDPKQIEVVVPPGSFVGSLIATLSLNTEATIAVISSGQRVVQENSVTANNFAAPVLYSVEVPGEKEPWLYRVTVREADTEARLAQISFPDGYLLQPPFNPEVRLYTVEVPYATRSVALEARGQSRTLRTITIDANPYRGSQARATAEFTEAQERSLTIETLAEDGRSAERYTLTILRGEPDRNASLGQLEVAGQPLSPAFSPRQPMYLVQVPYDARQLTLVARPESPYATVALSDAESGAPLRLEGEPTAKDGARVEFAAGQRLPVAVLVTAQDGSVREYRLDVLRAEPDRNNLLAALGVAGGSVSPAFTSNRSAYVVTVPFSTRKLALTAQPQSRYAAVRVRGGTVSTAQSLPFSGDPTSAEGAAVDFPAGERLLLVVEVAAQDGSLRPYALDVRRAPPDSNATLGSLIATQGVLRPVFSPRTVSYNLDLPGAAASVGLTAAAASPVAAVGVAEQPAVRPAATQSVTAALDPGQTAVISFLVTAEDGSQRLYRVSVHRAELPVVEIGSALLASLQVSGAVLRPDFSPATNAYDALVPADTGVVYINAAPQDPTAQVFVDGRPLSGGGIAMAVNPGFTLMVMIEVKAQNGNASRYVLQLTRPAGTQAGDQASAQQPQPGGQSASPQPGSGQVSVEAKNLRLGDREAAALAGDRIGGQARVTVRVYRGSPVLSEEVVGVQSRQQGKTYALSFGYRSPLLTVDPDRLVEVDVAIPTARGRYLYYSEARYLEENGVVEVPFLLYGSQPQASWPPLGTPVKVAGYVSLLRYDKDKGDRAADHEQFETDAQGEYGISVQLSDPASGRVLAQETVRSRPGLALGRTFTFGRDLQLPEGSSVRYLLTARARNGRLWQAQGTTQVWTTMLEYNGGFEPALLFVADDLAPGSR